jgi:hypothetical protein
MGIFPADRPKPASLLDAVYNTGTGLYRDAGRALGWFARQAAKPDAEVQSDFRDFASDMGTSLASIPKQAIGASTEAVETGNYNPAPIVDAAMLPMGGPAAKAGEFVLGAGAKKATPLIGVLHGAGSPVEFGPLVHPPPTHDLGIHTAIEPHLTHGYAVKHGSNFNAWPYVVGPGEKPKIDFISGERFDAPGAAGPRTKPYLLDADGTLKYPVDAGKWNSADSVIPPIEDEMRRGKAYPRGLLEDLHNISGSDEMWQSQFGPMLQDRGINHLFYPHAGSNTYDSFLTLDPNKLTPRYTPEGVKLAEERGVVEPMSHISRRPYPGADIWEEKKWVAPRGIMYKPQEGIESLVKLEDPKKNTFKWWGDDAPPSKIKEISDKTSAEYDYHKAHSGYNLSINKLNMDHSKGKISDDDFIKSYNELKANKPAVDPQYSSHYYGDKATAEEALQTNKSHSILDDLSKKYNKGQITKEQYWEGAKKAKPDGNDFYPLPYPGQLKDNKKLFGSYLKGDITKEDLFKEHKILYQYDTDKDVLHHTAKDGTFHKIYANPETEQFYEQMDTLQNHYNEGTINTDTFKKNMQKLKDDFHGPQPDDPGGFKQSAIYKANPHLYGGSAAPPPSASSVVQKSDGIFKTPPKSVLSPGDDTAHFDSIIAKMDEELAKKGLDKTQKAAQGILSPKKEAKKQAADIKASFALAQIEEANAKLAAGTISESEHKNLIQKAFYQ